MPNQSIHQASPMAERLRPWATGLLAVAFTAAFVAGCGGSGGSSTANRSFTQGTITGFGSIILNNNVAFDDTSASVTDDDGVAQDRSALKLGMQVEVEGSQIDKANASATAAKIRFGSEIVGPAADINSKAGSFTVLSQNIMTTTTTVFGDGLTGGLSALTPGAVVEVHAQFNTVTNQFDATRIELQPGATSFKLRGVVSGLDNTAKTFNIGTALINFGGIAAADLPAKFDNNMQVRVRVNTTQSNGQWVAISVHSGERKVEDHDEAEVRGLITDFTSATSFKIGDVVVDATQAAFPDGQLGVALGANVEVEGAITNNVLVATKVSLEDDHANGGNHGVELRGLISALDASSFMLRGVKVTFDTTTVVKNGVITDLANDLRVQVKGVVGTDGTTVASKSIEIKK